MASILPFLGTSLGAGTSRGVVDRKIRSGSDFSVASAACKLFDRRISFEDIICWLGGENKESGFSLDRICQDTVLGQETIFG